MRDVNSVAWGGTITTQQEGKPKSPEGFVTLENATSCSNKFMSRTTSMFGNFWIIRDINIDVTKSGQSMLSPFHHTRSHDIAWSKDDSREPNSDIRTHGLPACISLLKKFGMVGTRAALCFRSENTRIRAAVLAACAAGVRLDARSHTTGFTANSSSWNVTVLIGPMPMVHSGRGSLLSSYSALLESLSSLKACVLRSFSTMPFW